MLMLEDDFTYVLRKALRGQRLSLDEAAERSGLPSQKVLSFSRGHFDPHVASLLAKGLDLSPVYARHHDYHPHLVEVPEIRRLILPFNGDHVNAWLISKRDTHLLFDTGDDATSAAEEIRRMKVEPAAVFITHGHPDHVSGIVGFSGPKHGPLIDGAAHLSPGDRIHEGELTITALDLSGHFTPSLGYLVEGLPQPVLVAGDAIFAGSIGGCDPEHYRDAIQRIKSAIAPLEDRTIILPGHGPATTVGEEKRNNPFFA